MPIAWPGPMGRNPICSSVYERSPDCGSASRLRIDLKMTWKIEKHSDDQRTTIRLIGRMQAQHLQDLQRLLDESRRPIALDLEELILVDLEAVRFLGCWQEAGVLLLHCSQYIRDWIAKEQGEGK
jgi:hypothetical protein